MFEKILLHEFLQCAEPAAPNSKVSTSIDTLSKDELNVLCLNILLKKYQQRSGFKFNQFVQCLGQMTECADCEEEEFLAYAKCWIDKINRGGLFKLSNHTLNLFACIEVQVQHL